MMYNNQSELSVVLFPLMFSLMLSPQMANVRQSSINVTSNPNSMIGFECFVGTPPKRLYNALDIQGEELFFCTAVDGNQTQHNG